MFSIWLKPFVIVHIAIFISVVCITYIFVPIPSAFALSQDTPRNISTTVQKNTISTPINTPQKIISPPPSYTDVTTLPYISIQDIPFTQNTTPIEITHGRLDIKQNYDIWYTPQPQFTGEETITYIDFTKTIHEITIRVTNSTPRARDDAFSIPYREETTLPLLANDTDKESQQLSITHIQETQLAPDSLNTINISCGTIYFDTRPSVSQDLDSVVFLPYPQAQGVCSFSYAVSDEQGNTATAQVLLTIETRSVITDLAIQTRYISHSNEQSQAFIEVVNTGSSDAINAQLVIEINESTHIRNATCSSPHHANICPSYPTDIIEDTFTFIPLISAHSSVTFTLDLEETRHPYIYIQSTIQPSSFYYDYNRNNNRSSFPQVSEPPTVSFITSKHTISDDSRLDAMFHIMGTNTNHPFYFSARFPFLKTNESLCHAPKYQFITCEFSQNDGVTIEGYAPHDIPLSWDVDTTECRLQNTCSVFITTNMVQESGLFYETTITLTEEKNNLHTETEKSPFHALLYSPSRSVIFALIAYFIILSIHSCIRYITGTHLSSLRYNKRKP